MVNPVVYCSKNVVVSCVISELLEEDSGLDFGWYDAPTLLLRDGFLDGAFGASTVWVGLGLTGIDTLELEEAFEGTDCVVVIRLKEGSTGRRLPLLTVDK